MDNIIYASDMDRTLIFSNHFIKEHNSESNYVPVEMSGDMFVSNMDIDVRNKLKELNSNPKIKFIPVTTRDVMRYKRVDLGVEPEYAIVSNGGTILHNGEPMEEWAEYIKKKFNYIEALDIISELESELESIEGDVKIVDSCYIMFKTMQHKLYDQEALYFQSKYLNWDFVRQGNKCYVIPKHFSKQIALRWLWNKLGKPYIVASGDGELDLPMLSIANKAVVPEHSSLLKDGYIESCTVAKGGIKSPLYTMKIVEELL